MATADAYRNVAEAAWSWVMSQVRDDDGPWLPVVVSEDSEPVFPASDRDSLYGGIAGLAPVMAEFLRYRDLGDAEMALRAGVVARLSAMAATRTEPSLYDGLASDVTALRLLSPGSEAVALRRLAELAEPRGWNSTLYPQGDGTVNDVVSGTAGVVMAAVWASGDHAEKIATTGAEALLRAAIPTTAGLDWPMLPSSPSRMPNYSHGTAGIAAALAMASSSLDRPDLLAAAVQGAQHLLAVGSLEGDGFIVPHTIPPSSRQVEPVTYSWCHGPAGTSYLFAALSRNAIEEVAGFGVADLRQRCLNSILASGVPRRLRPGFWDNDGRCCGTAGVGDALLDAVQDCPEIARADGLLAAARTMGDALLDRAIHDRRGARWRFVEHRQAVQLLPPGTGWMQGAAGIAAFLLRLARVICDGPKAPVVDRPDQWWAVPANLCTNHIEPPRQPA